MRFRVRTTRKTQRRSRVVSQFAVATIGALAITVGLATHVFAAGAWTAQASTTTNLLTGVSFVDAIHGWAVGQSGTILATGDGGASWSAQTSHTSSDLEGVSFVDASHGWAVGNSGTILATADGGAIWGAQPSGTSSQLLGVSFVDANHGWAVGQDTMKVSGTILVTANGGLTWAPQGAPPTNLLSGVAFVDVNHGWAVGSKILATADGGASWSAQPSATGNLLSSVSFVDANHGWVAGTAGTIQATGNGGASWSAQTSGASTDLTGVSFVDANHGWAVGRSGTILATGDGGASWSAQTSGVSGDLFGVSFVDANHGWAVGNYGTILAFVNRPPSGTMTTTPSSGPPGTVISATSVTPCPSGSTRATVYFKGNTDTTIASASASSFDTSGNWAGTVAVPAGTTPGSYFVTASCFEPSSHAATDTQNYNFTAFSVSSPPTPPPGAVHGKAFNFDAKPLAGVVVTLDNGSGQIAGSRGRYSFTGVSAGSHPLSATFNGRLCRANSKTGPTSPVTVMVSGGGSTVVNWFC